MEEYLNEIENNLKTLTDLEKFYFSLYVNYIKIFQFNEFKHNSPEQFELVKNLFMNPKAMNKEHLEVFANVMLQNGTNLIPEFEKGEEPDTGVKILSFFLWGLTFEACVSGERVERLKKVWETLESFNTKYRVGFDQVISNLKINLQEKENLLRKSYDISITEFTPNFY